MSEIKAINKKIVLFCGPTISYEEVQSILPSVILPPAKQGDIYKAWYQYRPDFIGLIDGYFENTPSPWHKEILYVMSQNVTMVGASSMGALRAAELNVFGMIGIGEIFEAYLSGDLEDDDEVAVLHGPEQAYFRSLSIPMVNIRKTLLKAYMDNVISRACYDYLIDMAKSKFYKERSYEAILEDIRYQPIFFADYNKLINWLPGNEIDQKKEDAVNLLKSIKEKNNILQMPVNYHFENTNVWKKMREILHENLEKVS